MQPNGFTSKMGLEYYHQVALFVDNGATMIDVIQSLANKCKSILKILYEVKIC